MCICTFCGNEIENIQPVMVGLEPMHPACVEQYNDEMYGDDDSGFDDDYEPLPQEDMDGDFDSGMASAGFGTDEDYGYYGGDEDY
jgi:hypothetical protein